jgi:hypothetical protein
MRSIDIVASKKARALPWHILRPRQFRGETGQEAGDRKSEDETLDGHAVEAVSAEPTELAEHGGWALVGEGGDGVAAATGGAGVATFAERLGGDVRQEIDAGGGGEANEARNQWC